MVRCTVHLYFPPGWELGEASVVEPAAVLELGARIERSCRAAAHAVSGLAARGWACRLGRYEVLAEKRCDRAAAMRDLLRAGLDPVALGLEELPDGGPPAQGPSS